REGRTPVARPQADAAHPRRPGHAPVGPRPLRQDGASSVRDGRLRRSHRLREDHDPVRPAQPDKQHRVEHHDDRGPGRDRLPVDKAVRWRRRGPVWRGEGCNCCAGTGYIDRIWAYVILRVTDEIRRLVIDNAPLDELKRVAISQGMSTLLHEGIRLVNEDTTTI